jgi:hypothetical protein
MLFSNIGPSTEKGTIPIHELRLFVFYKELRNKKLFFNKPAPFVEE